jgi:hypothetical protein
MYKYYSTRVEEVTGKRFQGKDFSQSIIRLKIHQVVATAGAPEAKHLLFGDDF